MRTVGIKLADGSFYPIMEEGSAQKKTLELTTANDNQTCVMVDLYRSKNCTMEDAEYIDTLKIENLNAHQNGEPNISFDVGLDENGELSASIADPETGATSNSQITLVSRTAEERLVTDDFAVEEPAVEEPAVEEETAVDEPVVEEPVVDEPVNEEDSDSGNGAAVAAGVVAGAGLMAAAGIMAANRNNDEETDETLPDMDFDMDEESVEPTETITDDDFSLGDEGPDTTETIEETPADDFSMPEDSTISEEDNFSVPDDATIASDDDFSMPDDTTVTSDDDFSMPEDTTVASDDDFSMPDDSTIPGDETILEDESFAAPSELTETQEEDTDDFFNNIDSDPTPAPAQELNFSGLYDKETEMGESAVHDDDDIKKKTRAPVIICVICAIICIVATILVLLVVPGKFNLRQKHADKKAQTAVEKTAEKTTPAPVEEKKPDPAPQAKEDEVVVIEKAEDVKPVPPPAAETKSKNVTYKIKWGDTLWDIADTYYKNPWRYKKIANYNGIKNPDHIISGTVITIPAE